MFAWYLVVLDIMGTLMMGCWHPICLLILHGSLSVDVAPSIAVPPWMSTDGIELDCIAYNLCIRTVRERINDPINFPIPLIADGVEGSSCYQLTIPVNFDWATVQDFIGQKTLHHLSPSGCETILSFAPVSCQAA